MTEDQFDEFFRNRLLKYSSEVPGDMWQRIQQKKDKDRKGFFLRWFLPLLIFSVLLGGYFIFNANENTSNKKTVSFNKQNIEKLNASRKMPGSKQTSLSSTETKTKSDSDRILSNKKFDDNNKNENDFNSASHQNKKPKKTSGTKGSVDVRINNAPGSSINDSSTNENIIERNPDTTDNTKQVTSPAIKDSLSPKKSSLAKEILPISPNKKENNSSPLKNKKWSLELFASPDIPFFEITPGKANVVDYIKRTHKIQPSFTVGVRVSKSFAKYFSIKTGFQYSQVNEKFPDSNLINSINRYRSIDIPILIGYDITNADFKTTINAGVIFNLYSWYKGRTIDTIGTVDINAPNIFKHNAGISLYAGVSLAKSINNKLQIFAEPYFRYRLSHMTKSQAPFKQKINIAGISFGLKYNF